MREVIAGAEININRPGQVLVVAQSWGEYEVIERRPLVGPAGHLFNDVIAYGGFRREDLNITNVLPETRPPNDKFSSVPEHLVEAGRDALDLWVERLKPSLIITLGNEAAYHFVPDWPTKGRGIYGAKGIEDRRGYFWETQYGWVLTLLHPAGALRKIVPGYELLRRDFSRAKHWLRGELPRQEFPEVRWLRYSSEARYLLSSKATSFDIETRFNHQVFCCGFTGDNLQPYVAKYGLGFDLMRSVLSGRKGSKGVAHNGAYDCDILDRCGFPTALYTDDTQAAWGNALEPELAFRDDGDSGGRLTRKGLASLATLCPGMNVPFWKEAYERPGHDDWVSGYPAADASPKSDEWDKLYLMGGRDSYITRRLWSWLEPEIHKHDRAVQYRTALETNVRCITMTRRGWRVDDTLRKERIATLKKRAERSKGESRAAALDYIAKHKIKQFERCKQCPCCGGGKIAKERCWRCAGFKTKPSLKMLKERADSKTSIDLPSQKPKKADYEQRLLGPCQACDGVGKTYWYDFNPYSRDQLVELLYNYVGAPKWVFKGKEKMDEFAQLRLLVWSGDGNNP